MQRLTRFVLLVLACLAAPAVADAQIYVGRNEGGTLVLSDRPLGAGAVTYAVHQATAIRTTRPAPAAGDRGVSDLIAEHASRQRVRPDLVRAVIQVESAFNPWARSHKGAMGLMQLMPATAAALGVDDPYDPGENIRGGVTYLRHLLDRFDGNEELALAAYNAGPGAVERHGLRIPPYRETRDYVQKIKGRTLVASSRPTPAVIYRVFDEIGGRQVPRYSNTRPPSGDYEVVARLR